MKVAVVLSGCGYMDGAEVNEAVLALVELSKHSIAYDVFAPDKDFIAINHGTGSSTGLTRNSREESARISRAYPHNLVDLNCDNYAALIMPGGMGIGRVLSNILESDSKQDISMMQGIIGDFYSSGKPVVGICLAPALISFCLPDKQIKITSGITDAGFMIAKSGNTFVSCKTDDYCEDVANNIITTPAFMNDDANLAQVANGIAKAVQSLANKLVG